MLDCKMGLTGAVSALFLFGTTGVALAAAPTDWSEVDAKSIVLFYPGQSTYDWLVSDVHKKGNKKVPAGARCIKCHEEEEVDFGDSLIDQSELEAIEDKSGSVEMDVQAAFDAQNLYLRIQWEGDSDGSGNSGDKQDALAIMIDDGSVDRFDKQGCWLTCHNGMPDTEGEVAGATLATVAIFSGKKDVKKYLSLTRTDEIGSWDKPKSAAEVAALRNSGVFLDLIQWKAGDNKAIDSSILEYRTEDAGGSASDVTVLESSMEDGVYTVVLQRKLDTGNPKDDKIMKSGGVYTLGLAVHDDSVAKRFHHTAFPFSLGIGAEADLVAASSN